MNERQPIWSRTDHILADLVDAVQWSTWVAQYAASEKKPPEPKPYPRPVVPNPPASAVTADRLLDFQRRTRGD